MSFFKRRPHRLYVPTNRKWFTRRRVSERPRLTLKLFKGNFKAHFTWFFKNAWMILGITAGISLFVFFLFFSRVFSINAIEVQRETFSVDSAAVENILSQFKGKNLLFLNRAAAIAAVQKEFPEFAEVTVKKIFPHTLRVELKTFEIVANLRAYYILPKPAVDPAIPTPAGTDVIEDSNAFDLTPGKNEKEEAEIEKPVEQKSLLNRQGQAMFDKEEDLELITVVIRNLNQPVQNRETVILPEHMGRLLEAISAFENIFQKKIKKLEYLKDAREIHLTTEDSVTLWITFERDIREQLDKLKSVYEPAELSKSNLSYVDLRVQNKVIYCLQRTACDKPL